MSAWWDAFSLGGLLPAIVAYAAIVGAGRFLLVPRVATDARRRTLLEFLYFPVAVAIIGLGLYGTLDFAVRSGLLSLPPQLSLGILRVLLELAALSALTACASRALPRHLPAKGHPETRYLLYGMYAAALLGLVGILLTSPEVPRLAPTIWQIVGFLVGLIVTYFTVHILDLVLARYLGGLSRAEPSLETIYRFVRRLVGGVLILTGVALSLFVSFPGLAVGLASLILAAGFLSIVIGLAAQSSISNVIAGTLVSLTQPFRIGDAVVFSNEFCFVEDIRLTYTVLRVWDNRRLMVPNSLFMSQMVVNYTAVDATMLVPLTLNVSYDSDMARAMEIMLEEAKRHPKCLPVGDLPSVVVMDYTERGVLLRLLSRAEDQGTAFQMERDLLVSIRRRFDDEGIRLAVPYRELISSPSPTPPRRTGRMRSAPVRR